MWRFGPRARRSFIRQDQIIAAADTRSGCRPTARSPPARTRAHDHAGESDSLSRVLKLLAFVLPLGLDSFAVAAAIGATQTTMWRARVRISVIFVVFEAGKPPLRLAPGNSPARGIGPGGGYIPAPAPVARGARVVGRRRARHPD